MTKIAVTAASGNLGSEIAKAAIEIVGRDHVIGLARTPAKAESLGIEIRPGVYASRNDWESSLQGIDSVLLDSGMAAPDERIVQHRNVIEAANPLALRGSFTRVFRVPKRAPLLHPSSKATGKPKPTFAAAASIGSSVATESTSRSSKNAARSPIARPTDYAATRRAANWRSPTHGYCQSHSTTETRTTCTAKQ